MKKFNSRLTTFLKIKQEREETARKKLFSLVHQLEEMEIRGKGFDDEIEHLAQKNSESSLSIDQLKATAEFITLLQEKKNQLKKLIQKKSKEVEKARLEFVKSTKEKKVIENIEDKKKTLWRKEGEKQEDNFFDEISTTRFLKRKQHLKQQLESDEEKN